MTDIAAFSIFALTVGLSLGRPKVARLRVHHSTAALFGAALALLTGVVPPDLILVAGQILLFPIITIVSLMVITLVAERAGLFDVLAHKLAVLAGGDGRSLFTLIFFSGTLTGMLFTNDAAVLIFTPLVFTLVEEIRAPGWTNEKKLPFYFAVLYVGNLVGGLVISNPINIIVSRLFSIGFIEYAKWMAAPALVSVFVTYLGLRFVFAGQIPERYVKPQATSIADPRYVVVSGIILALTLAGFFSEGIIGIPTWAVALAGASLLLLVHASRVADGATQILRGVGWDVIVFVVGIFIVAMGLRNAGLTLHLGNAIRSLAGDDVSLLTYATGTIAAVCSSLLNNHPTAGMMAWVIQDFSLGAMSTKMLVFASLIGGDLGPKMLPIGSLAALLWFRILRDRGVQVSYWTYIKIGVPITIAAVVLSIAMLNFEMLVFKQ